MNSYQVWSPGTEDDQYDVEKMSRWLRKEAKCKARKQLSPNTRVPQESFLLMEPALARRLMPPPSLISEEPLSVLAPSYHSVFLLVTASILKISL